MKDADLLTPPETRTTWLEPLIVDDAQLLRMASEPPRHAARILKRAVAFGPILALATVLLPVLAAASTSFSEETAGWGLRGLSVLHAGHVLDVLLPGAGDASSPLRYQPPLHAWVLALTQPAFSPGSIPSLLAPGVVALILTVWVATSWVRRAAGAEFALVFCAFLALHPQWLWMATRGNADPLSLCFLLLAMLALWIHGQTASTLVSWSLLASGLTWGLAILGGGIPLVLVSIMIAATLWKGWQAETWLSRSRSLAIGASASRRGWVLAIAGATCLASCAWWFALAMEEYGLDVWGTWLFGPDGLDARAGSRIRNWRSDAVDWCQRNACLSGYLLLGLVSGLQSLLRGRPMTSGLTPLMTGWFLVALAFRLTPGFEARLAVRSPATWEGLLVIPTVYLAVDGLMQTVRRQVTTPVVLACVTLTVTAVIATWARHWESGLVVGCTMAVLLLASAPLSIGLRRSSLAWNEPEVRRWIRGFAGLAIAGQIVIGHQIWWNVVPGRTVYESARAHLRRLEPPDLVSIVISDPQDRPAQLQFMLRALFPVARRSQSVGWDPVLTETIVAEFKQPHSHMLVVEWSRRELRLRADVGTGWQVTSIVEPVPYRQRRLAAHLIEPAASTLQIGDSRE